jgi:hypothetical protein
MSGKRFRSNLNRILHLFGSGEVTFRGHHIVVSPRTPLCEADGCELADSPASG